jgi:hypothetical protein
LHGIAREVRIVEISGLNEGQDVFDFLEGGGTGNDLRDLGERVPLWQPPPNGEGISQGPDGTVGEKPDRPEALPEIEVSDAGNDPEPEKLPPRGWLMGLMFCRQFLSGIMAEGGTGKTSLRILQFISMAIGRALTGHHVFMRCRVLIVSLEDSKPELQRRIAAARIHHSVSKEQVKGWLYYVTLEDLKGMKLATAGPNGPQRGQLAEALSVIIDKLEIDVVCIDPTIKAHELNENLNKDMDYICDILTNDLAIQRDMAVDLSMHQRKGSKDPGDADSGRGASSVRDAGRLIYTLTTMSEDEAKLFNISEVDRKAYVRLDPAKVNIAPSAQKATWYKLVGVKLGNKTETYPNGDEVQTVELWSPPDTWANLSTAALNEALTEIDAGLSNGQRFSSASAAKDRAAWPVVQRHCPDRAEGQCRDIVNTWVRTGLLLNQDYEDPISRKTVKGLYVDNTKRPT